MDEHDDIPRWLGQAIFAIVFTIVIGGGIVWVAFNVP
jgi:hypothetical protein